MSTFFTLLLAYCAACGVSSAVTPWRVMFRDEDPEPLIDTPAAATFNFAPPIVFPGEVSGGGESASLLENSVWFPNGMNRNNKPVESISECVHNNLTMNYNGTSWKLLSRGNCPEGEWGVLVAECQPACRPLPCPVGQLEYQGKCVKPADSTVCGKTQILYLNLKGSTYCDCELDHFYYPWKAQCYARRQQGPCDFGYFLDINQNDQVECMPNECKADNFEKDPDTGKCYRKNYVGYCPVLSLEFHHNNYTVGCLFLDTRNLFDRAIARSCGAGSRVSHFGTCKQEIVIPSITSQPRSLTSGCRSGAIRVGNGPCRRVNNY